MEFCTETESQAVGRDWGQEGDNVRSHATMRIHLRKVVTYGLLALVVFVVFLLYNQNTLTSVDKEPPWIASRKARPNGFKVDPQGPFHKHVIRAKKSSPPTTEKPRPFGSRLWPTLDYYDDDRILAQMAHRPKSVLEKEKKGESVMDKVILAYHGYGSWGVQPGRKQFQDQKCPVQNCHVTDDRRRVNDADIVMFHHSPSRPWAARPPNQIWLLFMLESPYHTPGLTGVNDVFNWTATYRHDSVIVAPYERFTLFNESVRTLPLKKNYAAGKTKKIAWFVSNCGARNGRRQYVEELAKYIQVDIYGACGPLRCPRHKANDCFTMLTKDYKFYLSFENSNCRDYITEKFFVNGLMNDVLPIVMGAAPEDYKRAAPYHSFIHVDEFETPKDLAEYLYKVDKNDTLYNEYFRWKGTGENINTFFWCRICSMIHEVGENNHSLVYHDLDRWWRGPGVCIGQSRWRDNRKTRDNVIINKYGLGFGN